VRISSLLTDAPLTCDAPVTRSQCGACHACVRYCPAHALKNTLWRPGIPCENIIAISTCHKKCREIMQKSTGIDADLCGKCFAVCTYTKQYLKQCRDV
ncbi:MAG: epoxyqueuosine reductase, partial [Dorea sp.]